MEKFNFDLNEYLEYEAEIYNELEENFGGNKVFDLNKILSDSEDFKKMYGYCIPEHCFCAGCKGCLPDSGGNGYCKHVVSNFCRCRCHGDCCVECNPLLVY